MHSNYLAKSWARRRKPLRIACSARRKKCAALEISAICEEARKNLPLFLYGELSFDEEEQVEIHGMSGAVSVRLR